MRVGASRGARDRGGPSWRSAKAWVVLVIIVGASLFTDLASKRWAFESIGEHPVQIERDLVLATPPDKLAVLLGEDARAVMRVIPNVLEFRLVLNSGAIFGAGQGMRTLFIAFTVVALLFALWLFACRTRSGEWVAHGAIGFVIAGGIGNLYDRLVYGCVRDFIHPLPGVTWPGSDREVWPYVSNVADALLIVGIVILMIKLWRTEDGESSGAPTEPETNTG